MMSPQHYINLATALIVLVGGMIIVFLLPTQLGSGWRVVIAVFVLFYSAFRVGQVVLAIQRERREKAGILTHLAENGDGEEDRKTP
ncbi:MAG: hypothetical protein PHR28_06745 [candidate division Zixibacteria bacterium]|nr:hypothetical protein [candidate division Zixibacteria bacterium]